MFKKTLIVLLVLTPPIVLAVVTRMDQYPKRFAVVEPGGLYRAGFPSGDQLRHIAKEHRLRTVVSLTSPEDNDRDAEMGAAIKELKLQHFRFPMNGDGTGDLSTLDHAADALAEKKDWPILFHCAAGQQRTSTTLAAYWIKHQGMTCYDAIAKLEKEYGLNVKEDSQIVDQLEKYTKHVGARMGTPPAVTKEPVKAATQPAD